ncbi:amidase [Psychrobacillus soli]|uniref:Asp-tRNA(Asn)/Glu-tRNA(Gln) amidotransferase subunit GatA n=1 Tax=Psychrobacillus soli TaxID=1543965 RepID=A0A544TMU8_9BACI|nr:amidase [Psychrobacillus soli]TQR18776.1 Asp-tRNA(Asn)/Glu-tRNA(Gln) amidotransferase subunit GatA [Psychrobacillus soli]
MSTENFLEWDIETLSNAFASRTLSPVEVTEKLLANIQKDNELSNTYITVLTEKARQAAKQAEIEIQQGRIKSIFHGVPIAIKDLIDTKDIRTTMGSRIFKDRIPGEDATVVTKLKEAGAIIIGKTNTHEFAYGASGDRSYFGSPVNPFNPKKMPGGSSSGSGVALAKNLCYAALGTDTGGSIRIPASYMGIVGMKPSYGRVSKYGVFPLAWTLDHVGPMTRSVKDNALLLNVLVGQDKRDAFALPDATEDFTRFLNTGIEGTSIGVLELSGFVENEVRMQFEQAIQHFQQLGAMIRVIKVEEYDALLAAFRTTMQAEAYAVHTTNIKNYPDGWDAEVKERIVSGVTVTAKDYIEAQLLKRQMIQTYTEFFRDLDVIITPTVPIVAADVNQRIVQVNGIEYPIGLVLNHYTGPLNLTGFPALSLPIGISTSGLPIGLQIIGRPLSEANIYRFAMALESVINNN